MDCLAADYTVVVGQKIRDIVVLVHKCRVILITKSKVECERTLDSPVVLNKSTVMLSIDEALWSRVVGDRAVVWVSEEKRGEWRRQSWSQKAAHHRSVEIVLSEQLTVRQSVEE